MSLFSSDCDDFALVLVLFVLLAIVGAACD